MLSYNLSNYHCFNVQFSPYDGSKIACVGGKNYGLSGEGCLHVISKEDALLSCIKSLQWPDVLLDVAWSESSPDVLVTSSGDGKLQLWNYTSQKPLVRLFKEHSLEVPSVDWNSTRQSNYLVSASWDRSAKLWDPNHDASLQTFTGHEKIIHQVCWAPLCHEMFASVGGDGILKLWDIRGTNPTGAIKAHDSEALSCDWTKYDQNIIVTSGADSQIRVWDLRIISHPVKVLLGHQYPARKIKCSPFTQSQILSASYDRSCRFWDYIRSNHPIKTLVHHKEYLSGIDYNIHKPNEIVDCGWDSVVIVYSV